MILAPTLANTLVRRDQHGEDEPRLVVPFTVTSDMSSVLARSRTDIVAYDDRIVVAGPAGPVERTTSDRPVAEPDS